MKWSEVNHTHDGFHAEVKAPPNHPDKNKFVGIIHCASEGDFPILAADQHVRMMFAGWYEVELF